MKKNIFLFENPGRRQRRLRPQVRGPPRWAPMSVQAGVCSKGERDLRR